MASGTFASPEKTNNTHSSSDPPSRVPPAENRKVQIRIWFDSPCKHFAFSHSSLVSEPGGKHEFGSRQENVEVKIWPNSKLCRD